MKSAKIQDRFIEQEQQVFCTMMRNVICKWNNHETGCVGAFQTGTKKEVVTWTPGHKLVVLGEARNLQNAQ